MNKLNHNSQTSVVRETTNKVLDKRFKWESTYLANVNL